MAGKGSRPRPKSVPLEVFDDRFDLIFGKKNKTPEVKKTVPEGHCPKCGIDRNKERCEYSHDVGLMLKYCAMIPKHM
jgi:hypothetical protein